MIVLTILTILVTGQAAWLSGILAVLYYIGLYKMFPKSGIKGWFAFIPGAREYQLARCAGRESEGPVYSLTHVGITVVVLIEALWMHDIKDPQFGSFEVILMVLELTLMLINFVYGIRVFSGLINVYGVRRRWMWLWVCPTCASSPRSSGASRISISPAGRWRTSRRSSSGWPVTAAPR